MSVTGKAFDFGLIGRVMRFTRPYRPTFYWSIVLTVVLAGIAPLRPLMIQYMLDHYVKASEARAMLNMSLLIAGLLLIQFVLQYLNTYFTNLLGQQIIKDLRVMLYKHLIHFRLRFFDTTPVGTLITRTISDMETIADIFSEGLIVIIGDILQLSVIISVMFYTDWQLTLISLSTLPFLFIATNIFKNGIKSTFNEVRTQVAHLNTFVQEHITGMSVVQIFNREEEEYRRFVEINAKHRDANINSNWYYSVFFPVVEILSAVSIGLMVWWTARNSLYGHVSVGNMVAFIMFISMLFRPIRELADKFNTLQMGMVSSERVFKILDTEEAMPDQGAVSVKALKGDIEFKNVWFAYAAEHYVLKNISFVLEHGQTVALVGATGAGKSSIVNLISRFYPINKGKIYIDGIAVEDYKLTELRSKIAVVLQDVFLFSGTVRDNITLYNPSITEQQIMEASKAVGAYEFIMRLPGGFDYKVQERGATLSVGQRQLISFIRAYVYNPDILVLDEATSSIDSESERMIQRATEQLTRGRTSILIAHRLATIQRADKIIVLDKGIIVEQGTHAELVKQEGFYKKLYEIQFQEDMLS